MTDIPDNTKNDKDADAKADVVTGIIKGDRVCIACGFNLCGQRIVRESKYNLLIARCPECGQAAALQEYPLLGSWSNRWAATLAGVWLLLFFLLTIGCGMTVFGLAVGTTEVNGKVVEIAITNAYQEWVLANDPSAQPGRGWMQEIDRDWWESLDQAAIFDESGGVPMILWRSSQTTWIGLFFAMLVFGSFASVALLGVAKRRLVIAAVFPLVVASLVGFMFIRAELAYASWSQLYAINLGRLMVSSWTFPTTIALGGVFLIFGMVIGRPLARFLAHTALPNRFVQALAVLWTSEGREPPKPRR